MDKTSLKIDFLYYIKFGEGNKYMLPIPLNPMASFSFSSFSLSLNDVENPNMWWMHVGDQIVKENDSDNENDQSEEWMEKPSYL